MENFANVDTLIVATVIAALGGRMIMKKMGKGEEVDGRVDGMKAKLAELLAKLKPILGKGWDAFKGILSGLFSKLAEKLQPVKEEEENNG